MNETNEEYEQTYVVLRVQHPKNDPPIRWDWGRMVNALRRDETRWAFWAGEVLNVGPGPMEPKLRMYRKLDWDPLVD